jgi:uncharacterized repeat protein (TIGR03803 family)
MRVRVLCFLLLPFSVQAQHNFRVLHAFGSGNDGAGVYGSVILDAQGNVYGTTAGGGAYGDFGTVFRLTPENNGRWKETLLHSFHSQDGGAGAQGGLVLGHDSTLYGTTQSFGEYNAGTTFQLTPQEGGWTFRVIHQFGGPGDYACCPWGSLIVDPKGNLYGTSYAAFELSPGAGKWTETQLHDFNGKNGDGLGPLAGPIRDIAGNLYGTTNLGGGGTAAVVAALHGSCRLRLDLRMRVSRAGLSTSCTPSESQGGTEPSRTSASLPSTPKETSTAQQGVEAPCVPVPCSSWPRPHLVLAASGRKPFSMASARTRMAICRRAASSSTIRATFMAQQGQAERAVVWSSNCLCKTMTAGNTRCCTRFTSPTAARPTPT